MMFSWQRSWGLWPQQKLIRLTTAVALMGGARKRPEILQPGSYSQRAGAGSYSRHANSEFQSGSYSQRAGAEDHVYFDGDSGPYNSKGPSLHEIVVRRRIAPHICYNSPDPGLCRQRRSHRDARSRTWPGGYITRPEPTENNPKHRKPTGTQGPCPGLQGSCIKALGLGAPRGGSM